MTLHLIRNGAPVAEPVRGKHGYLSTFTINGERRAAVLFEWAAGEKPRAETSTYALVGKAAARIHQAADTFHSSLTRKAYDAQTLIDEQLELMEKPLIGRGQRQRVADLCERLRRVITGPALDYGVCHNDLTLDNLHRGGNEVRVFDLDSACESWRAVEPWGVLRFSDDCFKAWLEGYRSVRPFCREDEKAVAAFGVIGDTRIVAWKLSLARSSRGRPLMRTADLPKVVDEWIAWEQNRVAA